MQPDCIHCTLISYECRILYICQMCLDGLELESGMSALEAQLRGFGSELDYFLLGEEKGEEKN